MSPRRRIWVQRAPVEAHFQLGEAPAGTAWTLVGWDLADDAVDAGPDAAVAGLWSRALAGCARTTFPCSSWPGPATADAAWTEVDGDAVRHAEAGWRARLGGTARLALCSTRREASVRRLFDDAQLAWGRQAQVALLSAPGSPPPDLGVAEVLALMDAGGLRDAAALRGVGVEAVLRPGVDGDVAGLLAIDGGRVERLLAALQTEAARAGFDWVDGAPPA